MIIIDCTNATICVQTSYLSTHAIDTLYSDFDELNDFESVEEIDGYIHTDEVELPVIDENLVFVESVYHNNPIVISVPHDITDEVGSTSDLFVDTQPTVSISENTNSSQRPFTPVTSVN